MFDESSKMRYLFDQIHVPISSENGLLTAGDVYSLTARIVQTLGEAVEHITLLLWSQGVKETFAELAVC